MKQILIILFTTISHCYGQDFKFNVNDIDLIPRGNKNTIIYINALWCRPCLAKEEKIINYYSLRKDSLDLIVAYDRVAEKRIYDHLAKINITKGLLLDPVYYSSKGIIQMNGQRGALKKIIQQLQAKYPMTNWKNLYFGDAIFIKHGENPTLIKFDFDKMSIEDLNVLFN